MLNNIVNIIGDWGLGIGDCNPQSPIPNPHVKLSILEFIIFI